MASPQIGNQGLGAGTSRRTRGAGFTRLVVLPGGNAAIFTAICTSPSVKKFLGSVMETEPMTEDTSNNVW